MTEPHPSTLRATLDRAVAAGIITSEQADAIAALDAGEPPRPTTPELPTRRPSWLPEILGYLGGTLATAAAVLLGVQLWEELSAAARVALLAALTAAALLGGRLLRGNDTAAGRLGSFLWAAAVLCASFTAAEVTEDLLDRSFTAATLCGSTAALVLAAVLWWRRRSVLQHVAAFGAAAATLVSGAEWLGAPNEAGGQLLWALGLVWIVATVVAAGGSAGWVLGCLAMVIGSLLAGVGDQDWWLVIGALSAGVVVVGGVRMRRWAVIAVGVVGLLVLVPVVVVELLGVGTGPVAALLVLGVVLVAVAVVLIRRTRPHR